jgi:hypothetical protein
MLKEFRLKSKNLNYMRENITHSLELQGEREEPAASS